jgi:hypothetical protein
VPKTFVNELGCKYAGGYESCGSPGEARSDPALTHRFGISTADTVRRAQWQQRTPAQRRCKPLSTPNPFFRHHHWHGEASRPLTHRWPSTPIFPLAAQFC